MRRGARHRHGARRFFADADAVTELAMRGWGDSPDDDWLELWNLRCVSRAFYAAVCSDGLWKPWYRRLSRGTVYVPPSIREMLALGGRPQAEVLSFRRPLRVGPHFEAVLLRRRTRGPISARTSSPG